MISPKILVAIPAYRCEKQIGRVLAKLAAQPELLAKIDKIAVIDNQSPDSTLQAARTAIETLGLAGKAIICRNINNVGLGGTHKVALGLAGDIGADYLAILHGDDQATASELTDLIAVAEKNPDASALLGSRFSRGSRLKGYAIVRRLGNRALNIAYTLLSLRKTEDLGSGLNLFKVADLDPTSIRNCADGFTFNMDLLLYFYTRRLRVIFVPITWSETDQVSNARNFKVGWIALKTLLKWRFGQTARLDSSPDLYRTEIVAP